MKDNKKKILILGCGGHARVITDSIIETGVYELVGYVDNKEAGQVYREYSVIGTDSNLGELYDQGITCAAMGIGFIGKSVLREKLYEKLKSIGFEIPAIIDSTAIVAADVLVGEGSYIGKRTVVNSNAVIGDMCIINTGSIVEHDSKIHEFSHIAIGASIGGGVTVERASLIGAGAVILPGVNVGENVIIGAGAVVNKDVENGVTVVGVPGRKV